MKTSLNLPAFGFIQDIIIPFIPGDLLVAVLAVTGMNGLLLILQKEH